MALKSFVNLVAVVATASTSLVSGTAEARDWRHHDGLRMENNWNGPRVNRWGDVRRDHWRSEPRDGRVSRYAGHHRHNDHAGRAIAIGTFAAILGLALAAESQRVQHDYYGEE